MQIRCVHAAVVPISELKLKFHPKNRNQHPDEQLKRLARILDYQGARYAAKVSKRSGYITSGHGRVLAAELAGWDSYPVDYQDYDSDEQEYADLQADNAIAAWAELDLSGINLDVGDLGPDFDLDFLGIEGFVLEPAEKDQSNAESGTTLSDKFGAPPFSILDTRQQYWMDRKAKWFDLGLRSEKGRDDNLMGSADKPEDFKTGFKGAAPKTSVFDPVLCELLYRWFSAEGSIVLDPFAGGSVRGIVAARTGREYIGVDLRQEQVKENQEQARILCSTGLMPVWYCADSRQIHTLKVEADLLLSCPPYADLEVYSDHEADLSNMPYDEFLQAYREIIFKACEALKQDRFAVWVVGEVRDGRGIYRNFVGDTINAFIDAGLGYYNEAILVNQYGTAAMRANRTFLSGRKLIKVHQNVLVFCKGDPKLATEYCGDLDLRTLECGIGTSE